MDTKARQLDDYNRIEQAIGFIEANFRSQLDLEQIAASVHLSKFHFDRLFKRWAGVSPLQFQQFLTLDYTKQQLAASTSVLNTAFDAGLSGPGRLHDLFVNFDAMTPGEFKKQGEGLKIYYGFGHTQFGTCLLATTHRGICHLGFVAGNDRSQALSSLCQMWPSAVFTEQPRSAQSIVKRIFDRDKTSYDKPFTLHLKGTNFQVNVWRALLGIPEGSVVSYQDIAAHMGRPSAVRAVAGAIAANPVSYLIPCHRVIAKSGKIHNYRWGTARKKALIGWEAARYA
ncbi:MAG: methylated-DNA--[protein]-cysteine S-methyltransferase [Myxococcota bacterium]|nr:methylated-DNA--[protein]-cysteine S-methyltransferase [Myxococcota bacterium]